MEKKITGRAWKFADNVDTDQIIPAEYLVTGDPKELAKHAFEKMRPEFTSSVKKGDLIVAGENFGCGSSREHAPRALIGAGVSCVVAKTFARIFYRNSINIGLPLVECVIDAKDGDHIEVDFEKGIVRNHTTKKEAEFQPYPPFVLKLINAGGLVSYVKTQLKAVNKA
jgi:3-isopropylmalate/(R)-2-methylmalate dehydratase small subunit